MSNRAEVWKSNGRGAYELLASLGDNPTPWDLGHRAATFRRFAAAMDLEAERMIWLRQMAGLPVKRFVSPEPEPRQN